ncbi:hypothetical protein AYI68_g1835 [Smittium mucronatum]|uniref:Uncharacterized protein n=1 Tax=Smittium mucronatum TaxID=133383 RepID=A0A1R0H4I5_9FUNG|nr:hypothetical protein AYI68_g1835 [Smittium mucronatum]
MESSSTGLKQADLETSNESKLVSPRPSLGLNWSYVCHQRIHLMTVQSASHGSNTSININVSKNAEDASHGFSIKASLTKSISMVTKNSYKYKFRIYHLFCIIAIKKKQDNSTN